MSGSLVWKLTPHPSELLALGSWLLGQRPELHHCTVIDPCIPVAMCGRQVNLYIPAGAPANEIV